MQQPLAPTLRVAALCERILEEKDGILSLIRLVDRLVIMAEGANLPRDLPPGQVQLTALMSWVNGLGNYEAKIRIDFPGGDSFESGTMPFFLESLDKMQNLIVQLNVPLKSQGVYWFNFLLDEETKSRLPLRVMYQRKELPRPPTQKPT